MPCIVGSARPHAILLTLNRLFPATQNSWSPKLVHNGKPWTGPDQFEDSTGQLMMLPVDIALMAEPAFKKWVDIYAKDENKFFKVRPTDASGSGSNADSPHPRLFAASLITFPFLFRSHLFRISRLPSPSFCRWEFLLRLSNHGISSGRSGPCLRSELHM